MRLVRSKERRSWHQNQAANNENAIHQLSSPQTDLSRSSQESPDLILRQTRKRYAETNKFQNRGVPKQTYHIVPVNHPSHINKNQSNNFLRTTWSLFASAFQAEAGELALPCARFSLPSFLNFLNLQATVSTMGRYSDTLSPEAYQGSPPASSLNCMSNSEQVNQVHAIEP